MKRTVTITAVLVSVIAVYIVFFHVQVCVSAAVYRISIPSSIGICPPFVDTKLEEIEDQFGKIVAVGDGSEAV